MIPAWILGVGIVVVVLGVAYGVRNQINGLLGLGLGPDGVDGGGPRPTVWWIVDDSQVNARQWLDWGNRSTREPNEPYLQVTLGRARALWEPQFKVEPVVGRLAALGALEAAGVKLPEGADRCPPALWMPYCRAAYLAHFGGLWMDGSTLPLAAGSEVRARLTGRPVLMFGADPEEALASAAQTGAGSPAGGVTAGWAAAPGHPMWTGLERDLGALIAEGDQSWSAPEARRALRFAWDKHCSGVTAVDREAEVSRDRYGRALDWDDLFDTTEWPDGEEAIKKGLWLPMPGGRDALERASAWAWFTRMSVEQIRAADFNWARWATRV